MCSETSPDRDLKSPSAYKILTSNTSPLFYISRPWLRVQRIASLSRILMLTRKNYKVHANIGPTISLMRRAVALLDTGAGPNLIRKNELLQGMQTCIAHEPLWDVRNAKNRPLRIIGSLKMLVQLGWFIALVEFIVREKRTVLLILGTDYCNKFVEAIYLRKRKVVPENLSRIPIIRHLSRVGKGKSQRLMKTLSLTSWEHR